MDADFLEKIRRGAELLRDVKKRDYHYNVRELVYERDKTKLYHYKARVSNPHQIPLLVVFATVNRPEILDLFPEHSFIRGLLDNGMDVYLLDWGYPDADDADVGLNDYVNEYLDHAVKYILQTSGQAKIDLLGICQGGVLCLCYAALNKNLNNLILITTPIDFMTAENTVGQLLNTISNDAMTDEKGNVSGVLLSQFFIMLRPFELIGKKYLKYVDQIDDAKKTENFLQVERWLNDAPDQPARAFTELADQCYKENRLIKNEIVLDGRRVNLKNITIPVFNIMAEQDEIVPVSASSCLNKYINSSHYTQRLYPSGHIGIYVSSKVSGMMPADIAEWLIHKF